MASKATATAPKAPIQKQAPKASAKRFVKRQFEAQKPRPKIVDHIKSLMLQLLALEEREQLVKNERDTEKHYHCAVAALAELRKSASDDEVLRSWTELALQRALVDTALESLSQEREIEYAEAERSIVEDSFSSQDGEAAEGFPWSPDSR